MGVEKCGGADGLETLESKGCRGASQLGINIWKLMNLMAERGEYWLQRQKDREHVDGREASSGNL